MADTSRLHLTQIGADLGTRRGRSKWIVLWTLATGLGWGVPAAAIITLTDDLHEAAFSSFRIGLATLVVCAALSGAAIGIAQWLILRRWASGAAWWILATIAGWIIGFVAGLAVGIVTGLIFGFLVITILLAFYLGPAVGFTIGGGVVGAFQAALLYRWLGRDGAFRWARVGAVSALVAATVLLFGSVMTFAVVAPLKDRIEHLLPPSLLSLMEDYVGLPIYIGMFGLNSLGSGSEVSLNNPLTISCGTAFLSLFAGFTGVVLVRSFARAGQSSVARSERLSPWTTKEARMVWIGTTVMWVAPIVLGLAAALGVLVFQLLSTAPRNAVDVYNVTAGTWTTVTPTDHPVGPRGVVIGHTAYFARDCDSCDLSVVDVYDARADKWSELQSPSPDRETHLDLTAVGEQLVGTIRYRPQSEAYVFDTHSSHWKTAEVPVPRQFVKRIVVGDKLIFAGGCVGDFCGPATDAVDVYDAATRAWRSSRLSAPRWLPDHAVIGDSVAVIAGGCTVSMNDCVPTDSVDVYDALSDTWTTAQLSAPRYGIATAVVGTKAILAGGCIRESHRCDQSSDHVDIYDASTKRWRSTTLPQPRYYLGAVTVGSEALFYGETDPYNCNPSDSVDIYNVTTDTWTSAELSVARCGIAVIAVGSKVIFAGGRTECRSCEPSLDVVDIYESTTGAWSSTHLSEARRYVRPASIGHTVFLAGGLPANGSPSLTVDIYDSVSDAWSTGEISNSRLWFWPTAVHNKVVFTGAD